MSSHLPGAARHDTRTASNVGSAPCCVSSHDRQSRCQAREAEAGRCQLTASHDHAHAAETLDAYITWDDNEVQRWSRQRLPHWLVDLPWAPGLHPLVHGESD
jgi:hypothetical protein